MSTKPSAEKGIVVVDQHKPSPFIAPAAGASMGALLALFANNLEEGVFKQVCLIIAPIFAVAANAFWHWFLQRMKARQIEKAYLKRIEQFKAHLQSELNDKHLSREQKKRLKDQYDQLSQFHAEFHWRKVKAFSMDDEFVSLYSELEKKLAEK